MGRWVLAATVAAGLAVVAVGLFVRGLDLSAVLGLSWLTLFPPAALWARRTGAIAPVFAVLFGGPWLAVPSWVIGHPVLHVDNATGQPVVLWVDGRPRHTIPAHDGHGEPPWVRVPLGRHRLGWSAPPDPGRGSVALAAGTTGTAGTEVEITSWGEQLFTPGPAACHWLTVTAYGEASLYGFAHGPQPLREFARFDEVDLWFVPAPTVLASPPLHGGEVRTSLQRWDACMELKARGCADPVILGYVDCMRNIDGRAGVGDCYGDALRSCSHETAANRAP